MLMSLIKLAKSNLRRAKFVAYFKLSTTSCSLRKPVAFSKPFMPSDFNTDAVPIKALQLFGTTAYFCRRRQMTTTAVVTAVLAVCILLLAFLGLKNSAIERVEITSANKPNQKAEGEAATLGVDK